METAGGNYTHCLPPGSYTGWRQTTDYPWSVTGCAWQGNALLEANPFFEHCCYVFLYERETTLQVAFLTIIKKKLSAFSITLSFLIATMLKFECAIGQREILYIFLHSCCDLQAIYWWILKTFFCNLVWWWSGKGGWKGNSPFDE